VTRRLGTGAAAESVSVVLADMDNLTPDTTLAMVLTEALRIALQQSRVVRLVDVEEVRQFLALMQRPADAPLERETALEVARRAGAGVMLTSSIGRVGRGYVLTANLLSAESGKTAATFRVDARTDDELVRAVGRLSDRVRRSIGESARQVQATPPLEQVTTSSFEALRLYSEARRTLQSSGGWERIRSLVEQAIAADTTFGEAYRFLAYRFYTRSDRERVRVTHYLTLAYRYRDRMSEVERHLTEGFYHLLVTGDRERALTAFSMAAEATGGSRRLRIGAMDQLVIIYWTKRDYASAETWARQKALEPAHRQPYAWNRWFLTLAAQGKWEEARRVVEQADSIFPGPWVVWPSRVAYGLKGVAAADSTLRAYARRLTPGDSSLIALDMDFYLARLAIVQGRLRDAERLLRRLPARRGWGRWIGLPESNRADARVVWALANLEVRRDPEAAVRTLEIAAFRELWDSTSPLDRNYEWRVHFLARAGRTDEARALLAEYDAAVPPSLRNVTNGEVAMGWARGEVALAEGHPDEAVRYFLDFHRNSGYCVSCILPELGRALEAAGQPDSAAAVYERYLRKEGDWDRELWDGAYLVAVLERLADLREKSGDARGAAECYGRIVALWEHADPELQPRVRHALGRLQALSPELRAASGVPSSRRN